LILLSILVTNNKTKNIPKSISEIVTSFARTDTGVMSPYPTVAIVTMLKYNHVNTLPVVWEPTEKLDGSHVYTEK
jgi:histidine ammonia-lyase